MTKTHSIVTEPVEHAKRRRRWAFLQPFRMNTGGEPVLFRLRVLQTTWFWFNLTHYWLRPVTERLGMLTSGLNRADLLVRKSAPNPTNP